MDSKLECKPSGIWSAAALVGWALVAPVAGQVTVRVSVDSSGLPGNDDSGYFSHSISADVRYAAFDSLATDLVPGDTNGFADVFVRDRQDGTTERVSVNSNGDEGNGPSFQPSISGDGRYVAFWGFASNLVPGDTNGYVDVFVHDRESGATERVSVDSAGAQGNGNSGDQFLSVSISADGRYVAFESTASNLVAGDTNGAEDVFVHDRQSGATERVSVDSNGSQGNAGAGGSYGVSISAEGRYVAFDSFSSNLVSGDTNDREDVFVRDRQSGTTERVNVDSNGAEANHGGETPSVSAYGRYVSFSSYATNLVGGDTNSNRDVFVRDRQSGATERVSVDSAGAQANADSFFSSISADGRYVAFQSSATNLVSGDTNGDVDVFVRDRQSGTTERVSVNWAGDEGNENSAYPSISVDGRYVAFKSRATNLVLGEVLGGWLDVFVRDRTGGTRFFSICDPGASGVTACPCSNPPSGPGQGCDNSAATGGAILTALGGAYLSSDTLFFRTSQQRPSGTSILLQGNALIAAGAAYGQAVRCAGGSLKRLYTKSAAGGAIEAPDFGMGDQRVTDRSHALGDSIHAGESRWYLVYYRDPLVLGGCPSSSTFNATQTGKVIWGF